MANVHTPDQFTSKIALLSMGGIGVFLGCALFVRAFDTGSWWQYLGSLILFTLAGRLILRSFKTKQ